MTEDDFVLQEFYKIITPNKVDLFERIAPQRSRHIVVCLENIQQDHNASAVMRSMDCLGFQELHLIEKNNNYQFQRDIALGAARWLDVVQHQTPPEPVLDAIDSLRKKGYQIVATSPHHKATTSQSIDLVQPMALFFGAEKHGISEELKENADVFLHIPMHGFTESLNLSVSVAILLNTIRTRLASSNIQWQLPQTEQTALKIEWCERILNGGPQLAKKFREEFKKV
ncbi:MAG: TrmH family RNA methyltransferase [Sphingomonadales bacterium]